MPPPPSPKKARKSGKKGPLKSIKSKETKDDEFEEWKRARQLVKPKDQVELTDAELKDTVAKVLTTTNPRLATGLVEYKYSEGGYVPLPPIGNIILVYKKSGTFIPKDCEQARSQVFEYVEAVEELDEEGELKPRQKKKLTNSFNFSERAALTSTNPSRSQQTQTIPPPMETFSANVNAWIIYDSYAEDFAKLQLEKERERERKERDKLPLTKHTAPKKAKAKVAGGEEKGRYNSAWKTLERMVNLNSYDEIAKDYRYYEDPSDEFRDEEGTLLPLWKFTYEKTKKNTITDLCWNPAYYDLFAASFGFLDFMKPIADGTVCFFSIKNPSFPEYIITTESGAMCIDLHTKFPYMVVIGLYNGNVEVYNIQASCTTPAYRSNPVLDKHTDIVWQVKWAPDLPDGELNFISVSGDGKVNNWIMMPSHLTMTTIMNLYLDREMVPGPDGTMVKMKSCASCFVFHPVDPSVYMVGTEEGLILKCSTAYSSVYLMTYQAHSLPVYKIDFNKFNSNIFISCSGDWRVKIWEDKRPEPLYCFDIDSCVGDVQWAPYSSTVFACCTVKGRIHVFDININKHKPVCSQSIVSMRRNKLSRLAFNQKMPILIVGDDKGCVTSMKLSPNLRLKCKPPKKEPNLDQKVLQIRKLDRLLSLVREPPVLTPPKDPTITEHN